MKEYYVVGNDCGHRSTNTHPIFELAISDFAIDDNPSSFRHVLLDRIAQCRMEHGDLMPVNALHIFASGFPTEETNGNDAIDKQFIVGTSVVRCQCYLLVIAVCRKGERNAWMLFGTFLLGIGADASQQLYRIDCCKTNFINLNIFCIGILAGPLL